MYEERASRLPGAVVWSRVLPGPGSAVRPVLPDGCMDLLWTEGRLLVAGPDTRAYVPEGVPGGWAGVRFFPGTAPALLGVPAHELRDRTVEAAGAEPPDPLLRELVAALDAGRPVAAVADELGLGARKLHRRSLAAFGYGAKTLARVLRLQRALALARDGVPFADTAVRAEFADQAHLARDVRELAGMTLGELLRR
ncbi:helix-turn-helix domain-containing protein [Streptomyces sp. NPDC048415]|uniref:helix-turn-helix domain-containing protein n=1 Tax=Streptomyces sp. NPDC048415 TaxID=3154822 RepID=UPI003422DA3B